MDVPFQVYWYVVSIDSDSAVSIYKRAPRSRRASLGRCVQLRLSPASDFGPRRDGVLKTAAGLDTVSATKLASRTFLNSIVVLWARNRVLVLLQTQLLSTLLNPAPTRITSCRARPRTRGQMSGPRDIITSAGTMSVVLYPQKWLVPQPYLGKSLE